MGSFILSRGIRMELPQRCPVSLETSLHIHQCMLTAAHHSADARLIEGFYHQS